MQNAIVNVNGQISPPEQAKVAVFDRGFLYGDSLYEVVRSHRGGFLHLKEHLDRLEKSAELCRMVLGQSHGEYEKQIRRTFEAFQKQPGMSKAEAYCRLIVTRGIGKIGFGINCLVSPTQYVIIVQPLELPTPAQIEQGVALKISSRMRNDPRALDPAMKSGNYLNSLLAYLEAAEEDYADALMLNHQGFLTEGTTFNIFYVKNKIIVTPPLEIGILDGITRRETIQIAQKLGLEVRETRFPRVRLYEADEVFLSSTTKAVFPVTRVDQHRIAKGKPGEITRRLRQAYQKEVLGE